MAAARRKPLEELWAITWQAATVSVVLWLALITLQAIAPGLFRTPVEWWLILLLFAVHFVPRTIYLLVGLAIPKRRKSRGRKA